MNWKEIFWQTLSSDSNSENSFSQLLYHNNYNKTYLVIKVEVPANMI